MGGICPCLRKDSENLEPHRRDGNRPITSQSQPSLTNSEADDRTPLLGSADYQKQTSQSGAASSYKTMNNNDPPNNLTHVLSPASIVDIDRDRNSEVLGRDSSHETNGAPILNISERLLPDLIDVGGWGPGGHQTTSNNAHNNAQNEQLKQSISKTFQSNSLSILPDAGASNLSSLLSGRPVSAEICHFVARTASELSRLFIDEIKIVHREDLVVTFE